VALLVLLLELRAELGIVLSWRTSITSCVAMSRTRTSNLSRNWRGKTNLISIAVTRPWMVVRAWHRGGGARTALRFFSPAGARRARHEDCDSAYSRRSAETILLRIFRGTAFGDSRHSSADRLQTTGKRAGRVVRPCWVFDAPHCRTFFANAGSLAEDSSNLDTVFLRNRARHRLLPIIAEEFGEAAIEHMGNWRRSRGGRGVLERVPSTQYPVPSTRHFLRLGRS